MVAVNLLAPLAEEKFSEYANFIKTLPDDLNRNSTEFFPEWFNFFL